MTALRARAVILGSDAAFFVRLERTLGLQLLQRRHSCIIPREAYVLRGRRQLRHPSGYHTREWCRSLCRRKGVCGVTDTDPPGPVQPVRPTVQPHPGHLPVLSGLPGTPSGPVGPTARPHPNCLAQCPAPSKLALKEIHSKMHGNCCEHPVATLHIDWLGCHATAGSTCQQSVAIQSSSFLSISM